MILGKPTDPRAVANLLLAHAQTRGLAVSNLKLQKLLFLCHAFYLVEKGRPLISGDFEAWQYGPVHRVSYDAFKHFGAKPITELATKFDPITGSRTPLAAPTDDDVVEVVQKVLQFHGAKSAAELVQLTHAKDGPWHHVVDEATRSANIGLKISDQVIVERFKYLWFGKKPNFENEEPDEDQPLVA